MPAAATVVAGLGLLALTAVGAGYLAMHGAYLAGMPAPPEVGFDLRPFIYFLIAGLAGAILFGPLAVGAHRLMAKRHGAGANAAMLVATVVLAVLAFPAGFAWYKGSLVLRELEAEKIERESQQRQAIYARLRSDPVVVLRERWFEAKDERKAAYERSLADEDIAYDTQLIGALYAIDAEHLRLFLAHPLIDDQLFATHFDQTFHRLTELHEQDGELVAILLNPKAKKEWLEAVAASSAFKSGRFSQLDVLIEAKLPAAANPR